MRLKRLILTEHNTNTQIQQKLCSHNTVVSDMLQDGDDDLPGGVEQLVVVPWLVSVSQLPSNVVVVTKEDGVQGTQTREHVDTGVTWKMTYS